MENPETIKQALAVALKELEKHAKWEDQMIHDEEDKCCKKAVSHINSLLKK